VVEDDSRCTAATGLGFDSGVVAAMVEAVLCGGQPSDHAAQPREKEREEVREEEKKEKKRKDKKEKGKIGYKNEIYYIFLRNCES
jgi:hypothetical protein